MWAVAMKAARIVSGLAVAWPRKYTPMMSRMALVSASVDWAASGAAREKSSAAVVALSMAVIPYGSRYVGSTGDAQGLFHAILLEADDPFNPALPDAGPGSGARPGVFRPASDVLALLDQLGHPGSGPWASAPAA